MGKAKIALALFIVLFSLIGLGFFLVGFAMWLYAEFTQPEATMIFGAALLVLTILMICTISYINSVKERRKAETREKVKAEIKDAVASSYHFLRKKVLEELKELNDMGFSDKVICQILEFNPAVLQSFKDGHKPNTNNLNNSNIDEKIKKLFSDINNSKRPEFLKYESTTPLAQLILMMQRSYSQKAVR